MTERALIVETWGISRPFPSILWAIFSHSNDDLMVFVNYFPRDTVINYFTGFYYGMNNHGHLHIFVAFSALFPTGTMFNVLFCISTLYCKKIFHMCMWVKSLACQHELYNILCIFLTTAKCRYFSSTKILISYLFRNLTTHRYISFWDNIVRLKPISDKVINFTGGLGPPNLRFLDVMSEHNSEIPQCGINSVKTTKTSKKVIILI